MSIEIRSGLRVRYTPAAWGPPERTSAAAPEELRRGIEILWGPIEDRPWPVLLGFCDDGVLWGALTPTGLVIASDARSDLGPRLRQETLQRLHLFDQTRELRIWRGPRQLEAAWIADEEGAAEDLAYDEEQILLGVEPIGSPGGVGGVEFTPVRDLRGEWHAPPVPHAAFRPRDVRLRLRHYLVPEPETGMLVVGRSRLVTLLAGKDALP